MNCEFHYTPQSNLNENVHNGNIQSAIYTMPSIHNIYKQLLSEERYPKQQLQKELIPRVLTFFINSKEGYCFGIFNHFFIFLLLHNQCNFSLNYEWMILQSDRFQICNPQHYLNKWALFQRGLFRINHLLQMQIFNGSLLYTDKCPSI